MNGSRRFELVEHLSNEELVQAINAVQKADETRLVRRLCSVKNLYEGRTQQQAGEAVGVSQPTSSRWARAWNADGIKAVVEINPTVVEDLEWVKGSLETVNGTLSSQWERTDDGLELAIVVPWNTDATIRIPGDAEKTHVALEGDTIWNDGPAEAIPDSIDAVTTDDSTVTINAGSGSYGLEIADNRFPEPRFPASRHRHPR